MYRRLEDQATDTSLGAFVDRAAGITPERDNVYFDVSAVVRAVREGGDTSKSSSESAGPDWWPEKRYGRLVERLRKLGLKHILFGTDWPDWNATLLCGQYREELAPHER